MPSTATTHAFKGLQDWIEVFRAGTHRDSKGREISFTEADLDQMVANVALGAPPAVIGHPKEDWPAYAWAREVKRDGDVLLAKFSDINPDFERGVQSGAYRNRSVSVYKDDAHGWRVRHIGWLGAVPPAIPGLKPVEFNALEGAELHEFAMGMDACSSMGYALGNVADLLRGLRDFVISKDGLDTADKVLPDWAITSLVNTAQQLRDMRPDEMGPAFSSPPSGDDMLTPEDLQRAVQEAEARVRQELGAQFSQQQQQLTTLQAERQTERIATQIAGWKAQGLVLPADEPGLAQFMAALENGSGAEFQFSAPGSAEPAKKTPAQWFAAFMSSRKPLVKLGQQVVDPTDPGAPEGVVSFAQQPGYGGVNVDPQRAEADLRIKTYMQQHKVDYATAAASVLAK